MTARRKIKPSVNSKQAALPMQLPERPSAEILVKQLEHPLWTENKAKLIERYLFLFAMVTRHGTYIDGFAGPQQPDKPAMWAAKLVLANRPPLLRHFHLCEQNQRKIKMLETLKRRQPSRENNGRKIYRTIEVHPGDFNLNFSKIITNHPFPPDEPVFCLLDQRMFECHWATVRAIANCKKAPNTKIEQFYFLATSWLERSLSGLKKGETLKAWWGREDWPDLKARRWTRERVLSEFISRFRDDLGYKHVCPYPIYKRANGSHIMYYMIHATDHDAAPELMTRAYNTALKRKSSKESQLLLEGL